MKVLKTGIQAFAHAAALDKDGRLSNTIYCLGKDVFIFNQDHSVLIRFQFNQEEFAEPLSFRSEDYDSNELYEKDGRIVFVKRNEQFQREKACRTPGRTPEDVRGIWKRLRIPRGPKVSLPVSLLEFLDPSLSHVEFLIQNKKLFIIQRNIYSGTTSTITKKDGKGFFGSLTGDDLKKDEYGPVGMRTGDLTAMFSFCDTLDLTFPEEPENGYAFLRGLKAPGLPSDLQAYVCLCTYDELGDIQYLLKDEGEDNGREIEEKRPSQPRTDRKAKARSKG